jgi:hypothetical protein
MASNDNLLRIWKELKQFSPPSSALLVNNKETFLVVTETNNILTLLNSKAEVVYLGKQKCKKINGVYQCKDHLYSSPCLIPDPRIEFVKKEIYPLFFRLDIS